MQLRHRDRRTPVMLAAMAVSITFGLAACGASDAKGDPTSPVTIAVATTVAELPPTSVHVVPTTAPAATDASVATTEGAETLSDVEVADMEKQLDEIDQLLTGIDSDLNHD